MQKLFTKVKTTIMALVRSKIQFLCFPGETWHFYRCYATRTKPLHLEQSHTNEKLFKKILILNRGEIACNIIKTARNMGMKTVAVYSVADSQAKHVKLADESVFIGPSQARDSYLNIEKIIDVIHQTGADAVHPGYGFLSENPQFVYRLESENVVFIGPSADAISKMGDKLESKRMARTAEVNVIPGSDEIVTEIDHCVEIARSLGYPVIIKATAGGGGKGMRIARNDKEVREGFLLSSQEAQSSFNDCRMLVEKLIENPRHIEIQVLADKYGNVLCLGERECSIQRRNQKVIEEAPSGCLNISSYEQTRFAMASQAVSLCKLLQYHSAGTVEFLVDKNRKFYFLEMNTRLQVEFMVTQCVTGINIVQQMFRIAKDYPLNERQEDVRINGWAIESRIYAEDPYNKSLGIPSSGTIHTFKEPLITMPGVFYENGVVEGSQISTHYDPLLGKLICHAPTREMAIKMSLKVLDSYVIRGIQHNIPLLRDILTRESFQEGRLTTNYLHQIYPEGFKGLILSELDRNKIVAVAAALFATHELKNRSFTNIHKFKTRGKLSELKRNLVVRVDEHEIRTEVYQVNGQFRIEVEGKVYFIDKEAIKLSEPLMDLALNGDGNIFQLVSYNAHGEYQITLYGNIYNLQVWPEKLMKYLDVMPTKSEKTKLNRIAAPMPGVVRSLFCCPGDTVQEGQELLILEAMKMQNFILAPASGRIKKVHVEKGDTIKNGDLLVEIDF